jgi:hypothetical protein
LAERAEAIFHGALQLPAEQRTGYLKQACGDNAELLKQVEILLGAHEKAGGFLERPVVGASPGKTIVLTIPVTEKVGDKIGRYKLLQQIGEGGCGVVYMAEQEEPVRRRVALKVIKLGWTPRRDRALRSGAAGAGDDGSSEHRQGARCGATETGRPIS